MIPLHETRKNMKLLSISALVMGGWFLMFMFGGCSKASADKLTGGGACDTSAVSYVRDILPIMQQYCYSCHGNGNTAFSAPGVNLQGVDSGYSELSGWGSTGYLVGNVTHASGYVGMPYGKPKLDDCEIDQIIAWVDQHYPH
jgi:mono/diheme cytochrome c family protein